MHPVMFYPKHVYKNDLNILIELWLSLSPVYETRPIYIYNIAFFCEYCQLAFIFIFPVFIIIVFFCQSFYINIYF